MIPQSLETVQAILYTPYCTNCRAQRASHVQGPECLHTSHDPFLRTYNSPLDLTLHRNAHDD